MWLANQCKAQSYGNLNDYSKAQLDSLGLWYFADKGELRRLNETGEFNNKLHMVKAFMVYEKIKVPVDEKQLYCFMLRQCSLCKSSDPIN